MAFYPDRRLTIRDFAMIFARVRFALREGIGLVKPLQQRLTQCSTICVKKLCMTGAEYDRGQDHWLALPQAMSDLNVIFHCTRLNALSTKQVWVSLALAH